jgi:division protein CdvB (Snf7/Vps24/ESCRT-III family)
MSFFRKLFKNFDLFGEKGVRDETNRSPKEMAREWNRTIRKEMRRIDRDVGMMNSSEKKTLAEIKQLAGKKQINAVKILAKELVYQRKSRDRLILTKTQLNSISNELTHQVALAKLSESFGQSAAIMKSMNQIINLPGLTDTLTNMGKEMENMGLIESIMGDAIDEALADPETEESTEIEMNKIFDELAIDTIALVPNAGKGSIRTSVGVSQRVGGAKVAAEQ